MSSPAKGPLLRIDSLYVEGLGPIKRLDLPNDGLAWGGRIPDVVLVGGVNGSGKTTLGEMLFALGDLVGEGKGGQQLRRASRCRMIMSFSPRGEPPTELRMKLDGFAQDDPFLGEGGPTRQEGKSGTLYFNAAAHDFFGTREEIAALGGSLTGVVYIPSHRDTSIPETTFKAAGKVTPQGFAHRWSKPQQWEDSFEAILYAVRWQDANAVLRKKPNPGFFDAYAVEFEEFMEGRLKLDWSEEGDFIVVREDGVVVPFPELSSGEQQILLLLSELRYRWRPGSLVIIDEPELHLHPIWQTRLYEHILSLQRERGGQVWLLTQSTHLFQGAEPGSALLLGGGLE